MPDGVVVRNDVSRYGLRRLHILRAGQPVDEAAWLAAVGITADELLARLEFKEEFMGMHHLRLYWRDKGGTHDVRPGEEVEHGS